MSQRLVGRHMRAGADEPARLDSIELQRLWQCWREQSDLSAREHLITHYTPFVRMMAARLYAKRRHDAFEFAEYMQFGMLGLIDAMQRFDPARGAQFTTYAAHRISGTVLSGLARLSEQQQQQALQRRLRSERTADLSLPSAALDPVRLLQQLGDIGIGIALGILLEGSGLVAEPEASVPFPIYRRLELHQLQQRLRALLLQLHEREQAVIRMHYLQDLAFCDIAQQLSITRGRVSQLHRQGLARLRLLLATQPACKLVC